MFARQHTGMFMVYMLACCQAPFEFTSFALFTHKCLFLPKAPSTLILIIFNYQDNISRPAKHHQSLSIEKKNKRSLSLRILIRKVLLLPHQRRANKPTFSKQYVWLCALAYQADDIFHLPSVSASRRNSENWPSSLLLDTFFSTSKPSSLKHVNIPPWHQLSVNRSRRSD